MVRAVRVRQDLETVADFERQMNDRTASENDEQLWLAATRAGRDPNAPEPPSVYPGYVPPTFDAKRGERVSEAAHRHVGQVFAERKKALAALRADPVHRKRSAFDRILLETELWCGRRIDARSAAAPAAGGGRSARLRKATDDDDEASQAGLVQSQSDVAASAASAATSGAAAAVGGASSAGDEEVVQLTVSPSYLRGALRDYQLEGVNWLLGLHARCVNGVLADEMGLGKTFQTIATLAALKFTVGLPGPHLVVCPKSVLGNWFREFRQWCPGLSVYRLHGSRADLPALLRAHLQTNKTTGQLLRYDVIVTTYEMVTECLTAFKRVNWQYLIVDEAHRLKNEEGQLHKALALLPAAHRLIITGTPLQNNLRELWALLNFLAPRLFDDAEAFDQWFDTAQGTEDEYAVSRMHMLLTPLMLRRLKADVNTGIPPKKEIYVACRLSKKQRDWYVTVLAKDAELLNRTSSGSATQINNVVMQLRKVCDHPYLMPGGEDGPPFRTDERLIRDSGKMVVLDLLLKRLHRDKAERHKVLVFSQMTRMLDIIEDYLNFVGFKYCRIDGNTAGIDRDAQMALFNNPASEQFVFLLSTRAGGLGINLQAANHVVLYDSDWNPQADLQAQDRAHRIGQKRSVRVYRFINDGTVEERMYQRALKKLYLDAMVVQQGRVQQRANSNDAASREELLAMIKFGAEAIFRMKDGGSTGEMTEADIERLLSEGEQKMNALADDAMKATQNSLASFKLGVQESNLYDFEGVKYGGNAETRLLHITLKDGAPPMSQEEIHAKCAEFGEVVKASLHPNLREALVTFRSQAGAAEAHAKLPAGRDSPFAVRFVSRESAAIVTAEMIEEGYSGTTAGGERLGRGQRVREAVKFYTDEDLERIEAQQQHRSVKAPPLKLPKKPVFPAHQLFNAKRLLELHNLEVAILVRNWKRKYESGGGGSPTTAGAPATADAAAADAAAGADETAAAAAAVVEESLTPAELEERERLLADGFPNWTGKEFNTVRRAIIEFGESNYDAIAAALNGTKTLGEVRDYVPALLERGAAAGLPFFDKFEEKLKKAQERRRAQGLVGVAAQWKIDNCERPADELKFGLRTTDATLDRRLFLTAFDAGLKLPPGAVKKLPETRFNVYYQSRSESFFNDRLKLLLASVKREHARATAQANDVDGALKAAMQARKRARKDKKAAEEQEVAAAATAAAATGEDEGAPKAEDFA